MAIAKPGRSSDRWLIFAGLAIVGAAIVAVLLMGPRGAGPTADRRPVRIFSIPAGSMEPTLRIGERVYGDMQAYAVRAPTRGDIVFLTLPPDPSTTYVKRIVGLPGEKVQMRNGTLHINGRPVRTVDAGTYKPSSDDSSGREGSLKRETLPNGVSYTTLDLLENGPYDNTQVYEVPSGNYFVLGDNRDNSNDSRVNRFGYIPRANILGQPILVIWSSDWSRIGTIPR